MYYVVIAAIVLAVAYVVFNYLKIKKMKEGTAEMAEMAAIIRDGASTFLKTEFRTIAIVVVIIAAALSLFVEQTSGLTFLLGACMSSIVCILGMRSATYANVRTANKARESRSIGETVKVALCGGSISGLSVQALGLLGLVVIMLVGGEIDWNAKSGGLIDLGSKMQCNPFVMRASTYSLGCSIVAMFNRVAGGNYTKAADISSDILAKLRHDMPEDDSRVPNVIADFIGDNVNDIAGNCSDLLESFVATMAASIMIAVILFEGFMNKLKDAGLSFDALGNNANIKNAFENTTLFPIFLAGAGLISLHFTTGVTFKDIMDEVISATQEYGKPTQLAVGSISEAYNKIVEIVEKVLDSGFIANENLHAFIDLAFSMCITLGGAFVLLFNVLCTRKINIFAGSVCENAKNPDAEILKAKAVKNWLMVIGVFMAIFVFWSFWSLFTSAITAALIICASVFVKKNFVEEK